MKYAIIHINSDAIKDNNINKSDRGKWNNKNEDIFKPLDCNSINTDYKYIIDQLDKILSKLSDNKNDKNCNVDEPDIYFMIVPIEALSDYLFYVALSYSKLRKFDDESYQPKPIVFITAKNIFKNYHKFDKNDSAKDFESRENDYKNRISVFDKLYYQFDKRKYFLDSSIWHYYLPMEKWNGKSFEQNLKLIIEDIQENYNMQLYDTVVAREYLEFQTRMMKNSYLEAVGGGHAQQITPYVFHTETEMRYRADYKINEKLKKEYGNLKNFAWRVLLVDDYAEKELRKNKDNKISYDKISILTKILEKDFIVTKDNEIKKPEKPIIYIKGTKESNVLEDAKSKLRKNVYDVIMLDYLLGTKSDSQERELASELFSPLNRKKLDKTRGDLMSKFWILPISAFSKAMDDKIRSLGINRVHSDWYIFNGADPIATPQLFRHNFFKLIELQLNIAIVRKKDIINFILENLQGEDNANKQNNNDNDRKENKKNDNLRTKARRLYGLFMHKFGMREALLVDAENGSAFAKSVGEYLDNEGFEDQRFYEYTRKLIFLIGYGTHYDAPRMWEIFTFIREEVNKLGLSEKENEINILFDRIIKYLNRLT